MGLVTQDFSWSKDYPAAVTVCDPEGIIIFMNQRAREQFKKWGGEKLLNTSLFDCHPEPANTMIRKQLQTRESNVYITERKSGSKLVQQVPWYQDGLFAGIVETVTPIAGEIPVKKRE